MQNKSKFSTESTSCLSNEDEKLHSIRGKNLRIVSLGPGLTEMGGMGTVEKLILESGSRLFSYQHISTWESSSRGIRRVIDYIKALNKLLSLLSTNKIDLGHLHMSERGSILRKLIIAAIFMLYRKPFMLHAHGCEFHVFYETLPTLMQVIISYLFQRSAFFIVLSESWKEFYTSKCGVDPEKVVVLNNPVILPAFLLDDLAKERYHTDKKLITILFLGKFSKRKGIYDLLEAVANLSSEECADIKLIMAGNGELEEVAKKATALNIIDCLELPGWVDADKRNFLLSYADIFVLPSYNEGLPMALLEAMSWSLPSITTPVGGIPEVITHGDTGLLIEPGNTMELSNALHKLIIDKDLRKKIGKNARESVEDLAISNYSKKLFDLYYQAVEE